MAEQMVRDQFQVMSAAARGCDLILAGGALQVATRSVAEKMQILYVFAAYCPAVLPSRRYPPAKMGGSYPFDLPEEENEALWEKNAQEFEIFSAVLNEERKKAGLEPVSGVRDHIFTARPWLAADPALAPVYPLPGMEVVQTGAWVLTDPDPLPEPLEEFLAAGAPPVYLGFGSMRASDQTGQVLVEAVRSLGRRAILSQGWANLESGALGDDLLMIGDVSHARLFPRLAAIVHHGGGGTTTSAALAGRPQVIVPHNYDQFYWAERVQRLSVGVSGPARDELSVDGLAKALEKSLQPDTAANAMSLAGRMERQGARYAAERLVEEFG
jgi:vancomycin aglycone glucosyltransferase